MSGIISSLIFYLIIGTMIFSDVFLVVLFIKIRRDSVKFLSNSKKENFKKTLQVLRVTKGFLFVALIADAFCLYRLLDSLRWGAEHADLFSVIQLTILTVQLIVGIPSLKIGNSAQRRYLHLYPPVPTMEVPFDGERREIEETNWDEWFGGEGGKDGERSKAMPDKVNETLDITGEPDSELIKYVEGGYRSHYGSLTAESVKDTSEHKECPFCGTLNGIKNEICDFCGADMEAE